MQDSSQHLNAATTAALFMDFTPLSVSDFALDGEAAVARASEVLDTCRVKDVRVVHVLPGLRQNLQTLWPMGEPHPAVAPRDGEIVVAKSRIGAFSTTGLDVLLRSEGRTTLVLSGIATSGVVLSTARMAFDLGYRIVVVEDACSDADRAVHDALVRQVHPDSWLGLWRIADVKTAAEIVQIFGA
jgi:nicotinamidase-related amidase